MPRSQSKLEKIAHFATAISTLAAIVGIGIGIWQFNVSLTRADKQLELIVQERNDRLNESRPLLAIDSTEAIDLREDPYNTFSFNLRITNIGERAADSIRILTYTVATMSGDNELYEKYKNKSEPVRADTTEFITSLNKGLHVEASDFIFEPHKMQYYHIKAIVSYYDALLKKKFIDTYFYTVDFDKSMSDYHQAPHTLDPSAKDDAILTDSLVNKYYFLKKKR